ncbi:MAG: ArnT family glycosyltransferase [Blastocatellia bacterium]
MRKKSITADELAHIPAGCTYVQFRDYHLNPEHPPFVKLLSGLALDPKHPRLETYNWRNANQWRYGDIFFDDNDADTMLFRGRLPVVLLSLLLAFAVYCCAWEFYGWKAGCLALLLYVINPDMLAHGQLVTTDLGVTCFMFISIYTFWRALQRLTILRGLVTCIAVGLTLSTKFSGILVIPMLMMIGLVHALSKNPLKIELPKAGALLTQPVKKGLAAAGLLVAAGAVSLAIIWANYGFRYAISPNPEISSDLKWSTFWTIPGATIEAARFAKDIHLVPEAYIYGLVYVLKYSVRRMGFLLGATSMTGWWYYFPITFLVKTPLGLLLLILLGALFIRRYGAGWPVELTLLLPVAFYFAVAMATNMNIGHRHLLPIYPFLIVFASKMARALDPPRHRILGYVVAALVAWNVGATAYIYPHFLADRRRAESRMDVAGGFQPRLGAGPESAGGILQTAPREKFLPLVFRKRRPEILRSAECQAAAELSAEE